MYENGSVLGATTSTVLGAVVLPNTGENHALFFVALTSVIVGLAIIISTIVRIAAKKFYKA